MLNKTVPLLDFFSCNMQLSTSFLGDFRLFLVILHSDTSLKKRTEHLQNSHPVLSLPQLPDRFHTDLITMELALSTLEVSSDAR